MKKVVTFIIVLIVLASGLFFGYKKYEEKKEQERIQEEIRKQKELEERQQKAYDECMNRPYESEDLENKFDSLFNQYKGTGIAIYFTDINNNYEYTFNKDRTYYSASAIKLFDAIYLVENARNGKIDLHDTITYTAQDKKGGSEKTSKHNFGDKIPIIDLIDYALSVSDNAAHSMLVKYINSNNLNNYFKDVNLSITNTKPYEYKYSAYMANYSLKRIYDILNVDDEYSKVIKNALNNTYGNSLNYKDITMLHKYGLFSTYYHDIGIYDNDNPYLISILTLYGTKNYKEIVPKIHENLHKLYEENLENKTNYCTEIKNTTT